MSRKALLTIFLAIALICGAWFVFKLLTASQTSASHIQHPSIPVKTVLAVQTNMPVFVRSLGTVVSPHQIEIRPQVEGIITELLVHGGQSVNKGELLARIDDRSIKAVLQQQRAELGNIKAQLDIAKLDLRRYQELSTHKAIPQQSLEQQKALVNQLEQAISAKQAMIEEQQIKLSYTSIHAPISGIISVINIHAGNYVQAGNSSLFSIVQVNPLHVEISLTQKVLPELLSMLQKQALGDIPLFIHDRQGQVLLTEGTLVEVDNKVASQTGTIRIRAQVDNTNMLLWPGQTISALMQTKTIDNSIVVPSAAIRQGPDSPYVWRITNDIALPVAVKVIETYQNLVAVEGLQVGDEVVVDGALRLLEGSTIQRLDEESGSEGTIILQTAALS